MATPVTDQPHEDWLNVLNDIWENEQQLQTRQGQSSSSSSASQGSHRWSYSNSASSDQEQVMYNSTANPTTSEQTPASTTSVIGSSAPANTNESSVTPKNPPDTESNNSHSQNNNSTMATNNSIPTEDKVLARSERKRSREKQRRLDVNSQFKVLTNLLRQIETEDLGTLVTADAATSTATAGILHNSTSNMTNATNRVDLIARTVSVLERLHELNVTRKREISDLKEKLDATKKTVEQVMLQHKEAALFQPPKQDKVMMMVPMMVSSDTLAGAGGLGGCNMAGMGGMGFPMTAAHAAFMPQSFFPQNPMTAPQQQQQQQHPQQQPQQQQQQQQLPQQPPQQQHPQPQQQNQQQTPAPAPVVMQPLMVAPTAAQTLQPISAMMAAQQMGYSMAQPQQNMTQYSHSQNPSSHLTQQQPQPMYSHEPQQQQSQPQAQQNSFEQYISSMPPIPSNMPFTLPSVTSTANTTPPQPLTTASPPPQQLQQQGSDPKSPSSQSAPNVGGGNLAHCA
eukprot:scaffold1312_cov54-Attheya_sp.AAC.3